MLKHIFMSDFSILAVVIVYFPNKKETEENIKRYISDVEHVVVWENTPIGKNSDKIYIPEYSGKITYMGTGKNEGIGYALNRVVEYAILRGYTHILTMDQDSYWVNFSHFRDLAYKHRTEFAVACPNVNERFEKKLLKHIKSTITSGSLYNLSIFSTVSLFREDYFIDAVDTEFCYRLVRCNASIYLFGTALLKQTFGLPIKKMGVKTNVCSSFRTYHIIRNHLWLWREYPDVMEHSLKRWLVVDHIVKRIPKILLLEEDKYAKMKNIVKGVIDGLLKPIQARS